MRLATRGAAGRCAATDRRRTSADRPPAPTAGATAPRRRPRIGPACDRRRRGGSAAAGVRVSNGGVGVAGRATATGRANGSAAARPCGAYPTRTSCSPATRAASGGRSAPRLATRRGDRMPAVETGPSKLGPSSVGGASWAAGSAARAGSERGSSTGPTSDASASRVPWIAGGVVDRGAKPARCCRGRRLPGELAEQAVGLAHVGRARGEALPLRRRRPAPRAAAISGLSLHVAALRSAR